MEAEMMIVFAAIIEKSNSTQNFTNWSHTLGDLFTIV